MNKELPKDVQEYIEHLQSRVEALEKTKESLCKALDDAGDSLIEVADKIEALEKDAKMLDWMQENYLCADFRYGDPATEVIVIEMPKRSRFCGDLRVDIDTAMQSEKWGV